MIVYLVSCSLQFSPHVQCCSARSLLIVHNTTLIQRAIHPPYVSSRQQSSPSFPTRIFPFGFGRRRRDGGCGGDQAGKSGSEEKMRRRNGNPPSLPCPPPRNPQCVRPNNENDGFCCPASPSRPPCRCSNTDSIELRKEVCMQFGVCHFSFIAWEFRSCPLFELTKFWVVSLSCLGSM